MAEHLAFLYRRKIEEELGVPLPAEGEALPEDIELRLSRLVAPASEQLTGKAQQRKMAEENAKKQEDPIIQMAQKELDIKEQASKDKAKSDMEKIHAELQKSREKINLEKDKLAQTGKIEGAKILLSALDKSKAAERQGKADESKQLLDGFRVGLETAKTVVQSDVAKHQMKQPPKGTGNDR